MSDLPWSFSTAKQGVAGSTSVGDLRLFGCTEKVRSIWFSMTMWTIITGLAFSCFGGINWCVSPPLAHCRDSTFTNYRC